jgi:uncharacterized protein HemX
VSACSWVEGAAENIIAITSKTSADGNNTTPLPTVPTGTVKSSTSPSHGIGTGAIAGISVAAAIIAIALAIGGYFFLKRQRENQASRQIIVSLDPHEDDAVIGDFKSKQDHELSSIRETYEELNSDTQIYQLHSDQIQSAVNSPNLDSRRPVAYELTGTEVSRVELNAEERSNPTGR